MQDSFLCFIIQKIKRIRGCIGIVFTGSRQEGTNTETSDYDFCILLKSEIRCFRKTWHEMWQGKTYLVEIFANTRATLEQKEFHRNDILAPQLYMRATGTICYDAIGDVRSIKKKTQRLRSLGPKVATQEQREGSAYALATFRDKLIEMQHTKTVSYFFCTRIMTRIMEVYFHCTQKRQPKEKNVDAFLTANDSLFAKLYLAIHEQIGTKKQEKIIELIEYMAERFGLALTGEIYSKRE